VVNHPAVLSPCVVAPACSDCNISPTVINVTIATSRAQSSRNAILSA